MSECNTPVALIRRGSRSRCTRSADTPFQLQFTQLLPLVFPRPAVTGSFRVQGQLSVTALRLPLCPPLAVYLLHGLAPRMGGGLMGSLPGTVASRAINGRVAVLSLACPSEHSQLVLSALTLMSNRGHHNCKQRGIAPSFVRGAAVRTR